MIDARPGGYEGGKEKMKKCFIFALLVLLVLSLFAGCAESEAVLNGNIETLKAEIATLEDEISQLQSQKASLQQEVAALKVEAGNAKYVVTFNISQKHFTLDLGDIMKDAMNDISIQIPVDKEYYDSVEIGDTIEDSFRLGSFVFKGSFGTWDITVENKEIQ